MLLMKGSASELQCHSQGPRQLIGHLFTLQVVCYCGEFSRKDRNFSVAGRRWGDRCLLCQGGDSSGEMLRLWLNTYGGVACAELPRWMLQNGDRVREAGLRVLKRVCWLVRTEGGGNSSWFRCGAVAARAVHAGFSASGGMLWRLYMLD